MARKEKTKWEYGDFQTPPELARHAMSVLQKRGLHPATIIEPSCGTGAFLLAALEAFPDADRYIGCDINEDSLVCLRTQIRDHPLSQRCHVQQADFFDFDWRACVDAARSPILVLGNPPWVTSADLGMLGSRNLPDKSNFRGMRGLDAITGKSNFDISEWMLLESLSWLKNASGAIAVLCKSSVARKILQHIWRNAVDIAHAEIYTIDANMHFGAAVDACFLILETGPASSARSCMWFDSICADQPTRTIGYHDETVVADLSGYQRWRHLGGGDLAYTWRSGIKHDCSEVMELERQGGYFHNRMGEHFKLEDDYVFPMLKSSDLAVDGPLRYGRKYMLVTHSLIGEDTNLIQTRAPLTWAYLNRHSAALDRRGSSIYLKRPRFSVFGVGDYAFAPWKIAISGFYKSLNFKLVAPVDQRPVVLDDTVYFLPCWCPEEAEFIAQLLASAPAQEFLRSMIFWDEKRPITVDLLKRLNIRSVAAEAGQINRYDRFARQRRDRQLEVARGQMSLAIAEQGGTYSAAPNTAHDE